MKLFCDCLLTKYLNNEILEMMSGVNVVAYNNSSKLIILSNTILCVWFILFLLIFSPENFRIQGHYSKMKGLFIYQIFI